MNKRTEHVYFDFNATTPTSVEVRQFTQKFIEQTESWGNPSSIHWASRAPKLEIRESRALIASLLGCSVLELIFTSGGSESNNSVIRSVFDQVILKKKNLDRVEFITSQVEHPSVLKTFEYIETLGAVVHYLPVNRQGELDLEMYKRVLSSKTALVSIMWANNETGVIHPIQDLCEMAHKAGALFHTDAVQALGKIEINLQKLGVDFASFSAHKFYALKGLGALFVRKGTSFQALILGGAQERHRRGGTENVMGIRALAEMAKQSSRISSESLRIQNLRDHFEQRVLNEIPRVSVTAGSASRLANTSSLVLHDVDGETLLMALDLQGFAVSTGAACSSGNPEPSKVLLSMGLSRKEAQNSLRVSLGWTSTLSQVNELVDVLKEVVLRLRSFNEPSREMEL